MVLNNRAASLYCVFLFMAVAGLFMPEEVQGLEVNGLYSTSVPISSRGDEQELERAFTSAMREVLLKVSGTSQVLQPGAIKRALNNPRDYVESYGYQSIDEETDGPSAIVVEVSFFESEIRALLDRNNIALWPSNRPLTLVWVVIQEELGRREILSSSSELTREMLALIQEQAQYRGLPLLFPLMDLEDQQALTADQLWNLNEESIFVASARYQTGSVLSLRLYRSLSGELLGKSAYQFRERSLSHVSFEEELDTFVANSISLAAEELSAYYAILLSSISGDISVSLTIEGVETAKNYADLLSYVDGLGGVNSYQISSVEQDTLLLELATSGQLRQLVETITLENKLKSVAELSRDIDGIHMYYRWVN